ncbi:Fructose-bisphosphate aldolase class I [Aurantiacibacter atlanticus]|uniref:fructose-bisphosphate aldolase n=2 Tax=Aurantiacibacter atlanticus TaxID=1648404 RepID=A0A0H4W140_9SPHN|nr:class I fructose-bisphosphate aldolase [Aurantiacibacter atlanticus]AKQ43208.2 Fructose-bisphosphate aldolase class I [Aurantiacibacter atlanticus]
MNNPQMMAQIVGGAGFVAAIDQSGGSTPNALNALGLPPDAYADEEEMYALMDNVRNWIMRSSVFSGRKILAAILFERTMDADLKGRPVPQYLWDKGIVPFVKVDKGLADERGGVRLMNANPDLENVLERAASLGVFGTKMRSLISADSVSGIRALVEQQFETANLILERDLVPIVEPEVAIASPVRSECDRILLAELMRALKRQPHGRRVILKLTLPVEENLFAPLVAHPNCARVLALSGGLSQQDACAGLARNRGMIASFSRALLQDLRAQMDHGEFNRVLGEAIDRVYRASTMKVLTSPQDGR